MAAAATNLVYPNRLYCNACGKLIDENSKNGLCAFCDREIDDLKNITKPKKSSVFIDLDGDKGQKNIHYTKLFSCYPYNGAIRNLVRSFKYHNAPYIGEDIGNMMIARLEDFLLENANSETGELLHIDFLTAVPMASKKKLKRGYNQAELLAEKLSSRFSIPYISDIIFRNIHTTSPLSSMGKVDRIMQTSQMYSLNEKYLEARNKTILLVDDVCTTGATMNSIAKELQKTNPKNIFAFSFAIGQDMLYNII
jgi:competence protein ComFC